MKALTVKQPYANLIASGEKPLEIRSRRTHYRGTLLICSSKKPAIAPAGFALAVVELYDCRLMAPEDAALAHCDYIKGYWAWCLRDVRRLVQLVPVRGQLGIFNIDCINIDKPKKHNPQQVIIDEMVFFEKHFCNHLIEPVICNYCGCEYIPGTKDAHQHAPECEIRKQIVKGLI